MDEEEGDVSDVIRLRGHIGEEEKLAPKLLSADDGSAGDRIGSWKTSNDIIAGNGRVLKFYLFIVRSNWFKKI